MLRASNTPPAAAIVVAMLLLACKNEPPAIPECESAGESGGCADPTGGPEETPTCAEPEFVGQHPPATEFVCEGQAGGAIIYRQTSFEIAGVEKAGPGAIELDPPVIEFPASADVGACCHSLNPQQHQATIEASCAKDCARATCNTILDKLRTAVMSSDPSEGRCDALGDGSLGDDCRNALKASFEAWIAGIEANYDECLDTVLANFDASLAYNDWETPFSEERKLNLPNSGCDQNKLGCLFDAELRPFCEVADFSQAQSCEQAVNPIDGQASAEGDGGVEETGGGGVVDPWGDLEALIECVRTSCLVHEELFANVGANYPVFYDEGVDLQFGTHGTGVTGLKVTGLDAGEDSKELFDAFGIINNDVITHVNGDPLTSGAAIWDIIEGLQDVSYWEITVRRYKCIPCVWTTVEYEIALAVSFGAPPAEDDLPDLAAESSGSTSGAAAEPSQRTESGCGCTQGREHRRPAWFLFLGLLGFAARIRPRRLGRSPS